MKDNMMEGLAIAMVVGIVVLLAWIFKRGDVDGVIDSQPIIKVDTLVKERIDTIRLTHTITKYRPSPTQTDTIYRTDTLLETNEVVQHIAEVLNVYEGNDSVVISKDTLSPPTRVDYHWMVRNRNNDLDSLSVTFDVQAPIVMRDVEITKEITKFKKWNYGIQAGVGYGIFNRKPDAFIGVGVQYNIK